MLVKIAVTDGQNVSGSWFREHVFPARLLPLSSAYQDWRRPDETVDKDNQTISYGKQKRRFTASTKHQAMLIL